MPRYFLVILLATACGGPEPTTQSFYEEDATPRRLDVKTDAGIKPDLKMVETDTQVEPDTFIDTDSSSEPDAGNEPDLSVEPDSHVPEPDTYVEPDAGVEPDASSETDSHVEPDASPEPDAEPEPDAGEEPCVHPPVVADCNKGWCKIPAGCFYMGTRPDSECLNSIAFTYSDGSPTPIGLPTYHQVRLTHSFEIRQTEMTLGDVNSANPYICDEKDCGAPYQLGYRIGVYPNLRAVKPQLHCNRLSYANGLKECYVMNPETGRYVPDAPSIYECEGYRLPTEAEWEYVAKAGTTTDTYLGDFPAGCKSDTLAGYLGWYEGNYSGYYYGDLTTGDFQPNGWGLYDMLGGLSELVDDRLVRDLGTELVIDPHHTEGTNFDYVGVQDIAKGGDYTRPSGMLMPSHRLPAPPWSHNSVGFRCVRTLP